MTLSFIQAFKSNPTTTYPQFMACIQHSLRQHGFKQRPQLTFLQRFDTNSRIFSLVNGIEQNRNSSIGRVQRKKMKLAKTFGNSPLDQLLGIGPTTAVGIMLQAMALDVLFKCGCLLKKTFLFLKNNKSVVFLVDFYFESLYFSCLKYYVIRT